MAQPSVDCIPTSPSWKRPDEVMRLHALKKRKRALQARMRGNKEDASSSNKTSDDADKFSPNFLGNGKTVNPFKCNLTKKFKEDPANIYELDASMDVTLFQLLNSPTTSSETTSQTSFSSIFSQITKDHPEKVHEASRTKQPFVAIDWTLKSKVRFISPKPFAWNQKLKTSEEASGITGFVRCLEMGLSDTQSLDTSPNARFHQCCLVWQHPVLPWLNLFPRSSARVSSTVATISADSTVQECLHKDWCESFRSLFQLVRALQCPYFYLCADKFTCLFRAAGICGFSETHALLTPTTKGFRDALKDEDIIFSMPLKKSGTTKKRLSGELSDTGYDTLDSVVEDHGSKHESSQGTQDIERSLADVDDAGEEEEEEEEEEASDWLESMGVKAADIRSIKKSQAKLDKNREQEVDKRPESVIYVQGVEAQALFNFLMNCKSLISTVGPLAGVPPTLLAPVAFSGATLRPLKVRQSVVHMEAEDFHSMELVGPILPHTIHNLCDMLQQSSDTFSATFVNLDNTRAFSQVTPEEPTGGTSAFLKENLSDCGLRPELLRRFCRTSKEHSDVHVLEDLKYKDKIYSWTV